MFRNYLKTTFRFLLRNKTFSIVNLTGLAAGTICCLYIVLFVMDQYSYDKHHQQSENLYRLTSRLVLTGDKRNMATASPPIAPAIHREFPEVDQFTRVVPILGVGRNLIRYKDKALYEKRAFLVDSTFFDVFSYHFIHGTPAQVMAKPNSMVITQELAGKLFGTSDPVGQMLELENSWGKQLLTVTGVVDQSLGKSHIQASFFVSLNGYGEDIKNNSVWTGNNFTYSYLRLKPGSSAAFLESRLPAFLQKHAADDLRNRGMQKQLLLQPVTSIHTSSGYEVETSKNVSASFLKILLLVAALIQVMACINFMNLSTARASKRAKEVGVRKVVGAGRKNLVTQFLLESFALSVIGVLIALPLLVMALPWLNNMTGADIDLAFLRDTTTWIALGALILLTGLLSGSYPAFYLPAFDTIRVLKGNFKNHISAAGIRRFLVVFQFTLSLILIISFIVIFKQLNYVKSRDLGFNANQKLVFSFNTPESKEKIQLFMDDLQQLAGIKAVSRASGLPGQTTYYNWGVFLPGGNLSNSVNQENVSTDKSFITTMGIRIVKGRDFNSSDSGKAIINETLAKRLGLSIDAAPGTLLLTENANRKYEIAGVMKDFNYQSLHESISPFMLIYDPLSPAVGNVVANVTTSDYPSLLKQVESVWKKHLPVLPFEYEFLDQQVQHQYQTEISLSRIINAFTFVAILISCLGLFGLAAFSAEQRTREIAVRKVLGAGVPYLVQLLSSQFIKLVLIAFVIATPLGWWTMDTWLQSFVYRVDLDWWVFLLAGLIAFLIALLTVSFQAIKVAIANPLQGLRSE